MAVPEKKERQLEHTDYSNNNYHSGDRYDVDYARVVSKRGKAEESKWLLPLLLMPLLALGFWAGVKFVENSGGTDLAATNQNYKAAAGIGGGPGVTVTPTSTLPQAGIGGSGSDASLKGTTAVPTSVPSTGHGGK